MGTTGNEKSLQQLHMRLEHAQYRFGGATCWAVTACRARPMLFRCLLTLFNPVFHNTSLFSGTAKQQRKRLRVNYLLRGAEQNQPTGLTHSAVGGERYDQEDQQQLEYDRKSHFRVDCKPMARKTATKPKGNTKQLVPGCASRTCGCII